MRPKRTPIENSPSPMIPNLKIKLMNHRHHLWKEWKTKENRLLMRKNLINRMRGRRKISLNSALTTIQQTQLLKNWEICIAFGIIKIMSRE
jgi:hypothetical protein